MMKALFLAVTVAAGATLAGGVAQAATCSNGNVSFTLKQGTPDAVQQVGCYSGNDTNTINSAWTFAGISDWKLGDKTDDGKTYGDVGFSSFKLAPDYSWAVANPLGYEYVLVTLKQANGFAAFLLDTSEALAGTWLTAGPGKSVGGLSHASVYYAGDVAPPPQVPLPASAALLGLGVGALALLRRRKTA